MTYKTDPPYIWGVSNYDLKMFHSYNTSNKENGFPGNVWYKREK